ncbi:MAG: hypothetical protein PW786_11380 [Arachidicoccus sp.]|nr:hypothetical protein [Arachidicoccus sp.]
MKKEEVKNLFLSYIAGDATDEEKSLLEPWYLGWPNDHLVTKIKKNMKNALMSLTIKSCSARGL